MYGRSVGVMDAGKGENTCLRTTGQRKWEMHMFRGAAIFLICLSFLLSFLLFSFSAHAGERMLSFDVTAELRGDSSLLVTERIRVIIEHKTINHGIYRVLPISQRLEGGGIKRYDYNFVSVSLDGKDVPYSQVIRSGNIAIAIGSAQKKAPLGEHVYEIRYRTSNHVLFFGNHDEIYFNVTGNNWNFPIDNASFTFLVPGGTTNILKTTAFTGAHGEKSSDFVMDGKNVFRTTRILDVGEGLTVAVAWKKGLVVKPAPSDADWRREHRGLYFLALYVFLALYYVLSKRCFGEKPTQSIVPIFSVPEGMTPGYMAALKTKSYSARILHADILWAAVNGFLRIDIKDKKDIVLYPQDQAETVTPWVKEWCGLLASSLFSSNDSCALRSREGRTNAGAAFRKLKSKYCEQLSGFWKDRTPIKFFGWVVMIVLVSLTTLAIGVPGEGEEDAEFVFVIGMGLAFGCCVVGIFVARVAIMKDSGMVRIIAVLIALMLFAFGAVMGDNVVEGDYILLSMYMVLFFAIIWCMGNLPNSTCTEKAMPFYVQMRGLEMYILTAEKHRLEKLNPPEDTIAKYEELLPYAVALGCADAWQKRFDAILQKCDYRPEWVYATSKAFGSNSGYSYSDIAKAVTTSSAMSVAVAACVSAGRSNVGRSYSNDSGFSSGGSSGGGSGGGGGGGW